MNFWAGAQQKVVVYTLLGHLELLLYSMRKYTFGDVFGVKPYISAPLYPYLYVCYHSSSILYNGFFSCFSPKALYYHLIATCIIFIGYLLGCSLEIHFGIPSMIDMEYWTILKSDSSSA